MNRVSQFSSATRLPFTPPFTKEPERRSALSGGYQAELLSQKRLLVNARPGEGNTWFQAGMWSHVPANRSMKSPGGSWDRDNPDLGPGNI
jgi:hypothetical protein